LFSQNGWQCTKFPGLDITAHIFSTGALMCRLAETGHLKLGFDFAVPFMAAILTALFFHFFYDVPGRLTEHHGVNSHSDERVTLI